MDTWFCQFCCAPAHLALIPLILEENMFQNVDMMIDAYCISSLIVMAQVD